MLTATILGADGLPHPYLSYKVLMGDPAFDPCCAGAALGPDRAPDPTQMYAAVFANWCATGDAPPALHRVYQDLLADFAVPIGAVGMFIDDGKSPTGILKVTHGFRSHIGSPTSAANRHKVFGYVGDVIPDSDAINTFEFDQAQLDITDETFCHRTPELLAEYLLANPAALVVGPFTHAVALGAPPAVVSRRTTRGAMFIPFALVPFVLGRDLTARQAF